MHVLASPGDGCWVWTAAHDAKGYGVMRFNNPRRMIGAHRVGWIVQVGPVSDGLLVLHRCDNPPCVRADHLYLGTKKDNARDASERGQLKGRRHARQDGAFNNQAKLTPEVVASIRWDWLSGDYTATQLGQKYGVSRNAAWMAGTGRSWFGRDE